MRSSEASDTGNLGGYRPWPEPTAQAALSAGANEAKRFGVDEVNGGSSGGGTSGNLAAEASNKAISAKRARSGQSTCVSRMREPGMKSVK